MNDSHIMKNIFAKIKIFIIDYCQRHAHPTNAILHIFGVPMAFFGLYKLLSGSHLMGMILLFVGYLFQFLGHQAQGNEVGEVTLIKNIYSKLQQKNKKKFTV